MNDKTLFVMFKKPFEDVINSKNLIDIENVKEIKKTSDYSVRPIRNSDLKEGKWGGKYLRAPDVFFTILDKGKDKFIKLKNIADIKFAIKTGANEFFYLDENAQKKWHIEDRFLRPILKSPKECGHILIEPVRLKYKAFMCRNSKLELKGTNALKYIEWGENAPVEIKRGSKKGKMIKGYQNLETVKSRNSWYCLEKFVPKYVIRSIFNEDFSIFYNRDGYIIDKVMYGISPKGESDNCFGLGAYLNSTLATLFINVYGQMGLGEGALFISIEDLEKMPVLLSNRIDQSLFTRLIQKEIKNVFIDVGINSNKKIREQEPKPINIIEEIDNIFFDELGLTSDERKEVYWGVCELLKERSAKANSLKK